MTSIKPTLLLILFLAELTAGKTIAQDTIVHIDSNSINKKKLYTAIMAESAFYIGGMSYLQYVWYNDHQRVPFHFYNDNKGYLQVDKCGHFYGAYIESYVAYQWYRNAGVKRNKALIYGGALGLVLQTPIEVFDGLYEGWGFSKGDMIANAIGSGFVIGQELLFNEQLIKYKFSYWESPYAKKANGYLGNTTVERIFDDYNGHTYWLSAPIGKLTKIKKIPNWLNMAFGYGANGMFGEFKNINYYRGVQIPETERYRQYLFSLDIDWTKIKTDSKFLSKVFKAMVFIKLPFPAIEYNSKNILKGYWIYY